MKAVMKACFAGPDVVINIGDIVEGAEAVRYLNAGFAEPLIEAPEEETASVTPVVEKAVKTRKAKA